ncbi:ROK family transcriptional regulator [Kutzneria viridogrisea]|uniref:NBD/HSP70 family sugar kinase n=1 Tax=Kutzneria viridogrisea TaxID=47990 RepID=A0ABR6BEU5_9PSEU|nr:putative NBD/HSP70 family sugar kinase [Kutzneria viridogrisea]
MTGPPTAGTRPDEVRRHNRTALLRRLHVGGPCTRAELAAELGLNRSTIKALVDGLAEGGLVVEQVSAKRLGAGRPSLLVLPQPRALWVLAVDVGVEQTTVAAVGFGGEVLGSRTWTLSRGASSVQDVVGKVALAARRLADRLGGSPVGAGVSVPGVVRRDGYVHEAPNLHWTGVHLGELLATALRRPVLVGNDAELGALAEHTRGVARQAADMVFVSVDVGVGGGVISERAAVRGTGGSVGELGHMVVRPGGRSCYCGCRGCWETEVGEDALCRALSLPEGSARELVVSELRSLGEQPELALYRLREFTDWLALGLINVVNLLGPELVVLGDLLAELPPVIVDEVAEEVRQRSLVSRAVGGIRITTSSLGPEAKIIGAAELAFEQAL